MNTQKNKIVAIVLFVIIVLAVTYSALTQTVRANTIEKYESQIQENINHIELLENMKNQLHVTAELFRQYDYINNSFDTLLSQKWHECNNLQKNKTTQNLVLQEKIKSLTASKRIIGYFRISHYCPCSTCNGGWGNKTASGTILTPYRTIAVDPGIIPLGSKVEIQGKTYIAEDTGSAIKGNRIDICVGSHSEAMQRGVLYNVPVYLVK